MGRCALFRRWLGVFSIRRRPLSTVGNRIGSQELKEIGNGTFHFQDQRIVPYPPALAYQVCSDVEEYSQFVPWCKDSKVITRDSKSGFFCAELVIGFGMFTEKYISRVELVENRLIRARALDSSVIEKLETVWEFQDIKEDAQVCKLTFTILFKFQTLLHARLAKMFVETVAHKMVDSFLGRCEELSRGVTKSTHSSTTGEENENEITLKELEQLSHFTEVEIKRVKERFDAAIRKQGTGARKLNEDAFVQLFVDLLVRANCTNDMKNQLTNIAHHHFHALDLNMDGEIDFREFVAGMSIILKGTSLEKCRLWFRCYDLDRDGHLTREELSELIRATIAVKLSLANALHLHRHKHEMSCETMQDLELNMTNQVLAKSFGNISNINTISLNDVENRLLVQTNLFSTE